MTGLVAGASGFVGRRLCPALEEAGYAVRAMTRHPDDYQGVGEPVRADVTEAQSLAAAAQGCDAAYYLVHSLDRASFEKDDAAAARAFGFAASRAGLGQIVYLGGLGRDEDELSRTCAAAVRSRDCSGTPACLSRRCVPESSSVTGVSPGR